MQQYPSVLTMAVRSDGVVYLYDENWSRVEFQPWTDDEREEMFNGYGDHGPLAMNPRTP